MLKAFLLVTIIKAILTLSGPAFSVVRQGRGEGLRGPDAKNQVQHKMIENGMKLCTSHYARKIILDAKFEADSYSSFGDMTSQNFPQKNGRSLRIRLFTPGKRV